MVKIKENKEYIRSVTDVLKKLLQFLGHRHKTNYTNLDSPPRHIAPVPYSKRERERRDINSIRCIKNNVGKVLLNDYDIKK